MTVHKNKQSLDLHFEDELGTEKERDTRRDNYVKDFTTLERHKQYDLWFTNGMSTEGKFILYTHYIYKRVVTPRHTTIDNPTGDST